MLSVRDTGSAKAKFSPEFEKCWCWLPLVLTNTVLVIYIKLTDIRQRETSWEVTTLTGNSPHNTHSTNHTHMSLCRLLGHCMGCSEICDVLMVHVMYKLWCVNGSRDVQITKHAIHFYVQNACRWSQPQYLLILWCLVCPGFVSFKQPHDISVDTAFQIVKLRKLFCVVFPSYSSNKIF
jgi:hypothetical protein